MSEIIRTINNTACEPYNHFDIVSKGLKETGYSIIDQVFEDEILHSLFLDLKSRSSQDFQHAGIGRETHHHINAFIRRDRICWIDEEFPSVQRYLNRMEALRLGLNHQLYLGLFDFECHYAHFPRGAFYKKHLDAFRGESNRRVTVILYLNPTWQSKDGGELIIYHPNSSDILERVEPVFGRMVIFLSEEFPHEVLPAAKSRYSITGWFRVNTQM